MRALKLCVVLGLVLAVSGTAGAITFNRPYNGPIVFKSQTWDSGTIYFGLNPGVYDNTNTWPGNLGPVPAEVPFPGVPTMPAGGQGDDSWGIIVVTGIYPGTVGSGNPPDIAPDTNNPLWLPGQDGQELVGVFWGAQDQAVAVVAAGPLNPAYEIAESTDLKFALWDQKQGTLGDPAALKLGSAERGANPWDFGEAAGPHGMGLTYDAAASVYLTGQSQKGFVGQVLPGHAEFVTTFYPDMTTQGSANTFLGVGDLGLDINSDGSVDAQDVGAANDYYDTDFFSAVVPGYQTTADLHLTMFTKANNPTNQPGYDSGYDWTATNEDNIDGAFVPEPVTMLSAVLGVAGLAGYIRRRRVT